MSESHRFVTRPSLLLLSWILLYAPVVACGESPQPPDPEPAPPPDVEVVITTIDDQPVVSGQRVEVGRQVFVEGTVSGPGAIVCVLVHPMTTSTWWVQSLPAPPDRLESGLLGWRLLALCGTETLGRKDEYEIVAVAEGRRDICNAGRQLQTEELPVELPRSEIHRAIRVRD